MQMNKWALHRAVSNNGVKARAGNAGDHTATGKAQPYDILIMSSYRTDTYKFLSRENFQQFDKHPSISQVSV